MRDIKVFQTKKRKKDFSFSQIGFKICTSKKFVRQKTVNGGG
jgi:hypothetical protein